MIRQFITAHRKWVVTVSLILIVAVAFVAPAAFAGIQVNTIAAQSVTTDNGRHLMVTGPIRGTAGERCEIRVTVTQRSTGAVAEGRIAFGFSGDIEQWQIRATTQGKATFQPGPATAVAMARTTADRNTATDAHQWLVNMTLVSQ